MINTREEAKKTKKKEAKKTKKKEAKKERLSKSLRYHVNNRNWEHITDAFCREAAKEPRIHFKKKGKDWFKQRPVLNKRLYNDMGGEALSRNLLTSAIDLNAPLDVIKAIATHFPDFVNQPYDGNNEVLWYAQSWNSDESDYKHLRNELVRMLLDLGAYPLLQTPGMKFDPGVISEEIGNGWEYHCCREAYPTDDDRQTLSYMLQHCKIADLKKVLKEYRKWPQEPPYGDDFPYWRRYLRHVPVLVTLRSPHQCFRLSVSSKLHLLDQVRGVDIMRKLRVFLI